MLALGRFFIKQRFIRNYASGKKLLEIAEDQNTGIHIISMARPPVNSLNLELLEELKTSLIEAQKSNCKGIILTSSLPAVFSAGLDIMELYKPDIERLTAYWRTLQDTWMTLYGLEIPIAAAINGASPAGGCLLAISCEYRVFVDGKHTIGFNETQLGIIAPQWFIDLFVNTIGYRHAELALLRGTLFYPNEALNIGLVDELANDKAEAIKKCQKYISSYDRILKQARNITKLKLREKLISWLQEHREIELNNIKQFIQLANIQKSLHAYIETLKQKQKQKQN
ncbi:enoyl-CoA delta isomerase 1, mitochondrial-like [Vespa velutina]|uniref:enoyl-CoA delta isomerase 1, mitochondrial-like n=1 Tax=Vespa velutina TaxID=202808 RepID=UPI001FB20077|nr:enoyl-CoA delta isomerase 1, mitochondrial-like [Vespa velutina]XP_047358932.1 enoyl-CoA delta isomerase 1, mitochondrial-like [Vespa velutina]XP_047358933.1 enoyl-CoA delta isomerase 1, mitochondrial-like [Vespa velutina]